MVAWTLVYIKDFAKIDMDLIGFLSCDIGSLNHQEISSISNITTIEDDSTSI